MRSLIFIAPVFGLLAATPATATITQVIGGPGGKPFELRCPPNSVAVGVAAHTGAWVDGLALLCSGETRGTRRSTELVGSSHSARQEAYCPGGKAAQALTANFTRGQGLEREYLNGIEIRCAGGGSRCINTGEACSYIMGGLNQPDRFPDRLYCPEDEVLIGLVGKAGKSVDAIGAICGPRPGAIRRSASAVAGAAGESAYKDVGTTTIGEEVGQSRENQIPVATSPTTDERLASQPPVRTSTKAADGMQRNLPPPPDPPR